MSPLRFKPGALPDIKSSALPMSHCTPNQNGLYRLESMLTNCHKSMDYTICHEKKLLMYASSNGTNDSVHPHFLVSMFLISYFVKGL